jgi:hypothetical protein
LSLIVVSSSLSIGRDPSLCSASCVRYQIPVSL